MVEQNKTTELEKHLYKRKVTHTQYRHGDKKVKKGGLSRMLHLEITENKIELWKEAIAPKAAFRAVNDKYMEIGSNSNVLPIWGGGSFLIILLLIIIGGIKFPSDISSPLFIISSIISLLGFFFFAYYYFTMPPKEFLWNREDGRVTFPGFMWKQNITMPIEKVLFVASSPSAQGLGAYLLQIARPDKTYSLYMASLDNTCYEDLSFYLWYMDRNRPLPPGTAFDPYREQDFERRKAEGFPPPMFHSYFETPEATQEQQEERESIGGW